MTGARWNQSERKIPCEKIEFRATVASGTSAISTKIESTDTIQVFPNERTMEGKIQQQHQTMALQVIDFHFTVSDHRFPLQSNDSDDGVAIDSADHSATNDERPGNEEGNGKYESE